MTPMPLDVIGGLMIRKLLADTNIDDKRKRMTLRYIKENYGNEQYLLVLELLKR